MLVRIGITEQAWLQMATELATTFCTWIGQTERVERACRQSGQRRARGIRACQWLFPG